MAMNSRANRLVCSLLLVFCSVMFSAKGWASSPTVQITGAVARPGVWSGSRIEHDLKTSLRLVHYTLHGQAHTAQCVPLIALVDAAGPRENPRIKHHILQFVVVAQGQDGYAVAFSLGELEPLFGHEAAWVALDQDGKPLAADDGPVELLVPGDKKAARWVHGLVTLTLVDEAQADGR